MQIVPTRAAVSAFVTPKMVYGSEKYDIGSKDIICLLRHDSQAFQHAPLQAVAVVDFSCGTSNSTLCCHCVVSQYFQLSQSPYFKFYSFYEKKK